MIVVSDDGLASVLSYAGSGWYGEEIVFHLFANDITPTRDTLLSAFVESNFNGYLPQLVGVWGPPVLAAHQGTMSAPAITWTKATGGISGNVFGYFVTNGAGNKLLWSERDPNAPVAMSVGGKQYAVIPGFSTQNMAGVP